MSVKNKTYSKKRLTIDEFSFGISPDKNEFLLKENKAKVCFNLKAVDGALTEGNGVCELVLPVSQSSTSCTRKLNYQNSYSLKKVWRYKYYSDVNQRYDYVLIGFGSDNKIHFTNMFGYSGSLHELSEFVFNEEPTAISFRVNGKDVISFSSPKDSLLVWFCDEQPYTVDNLPKFKSICLHNERLFAIDSEKNYLVRYSSNLNPLDWTSNVTSTSGGSIELNDFKGQLKNLVSFQDNVFVFRDFGISKISSYSANSLYSATNIFSSSSKIFCNTACICGEAIYFLAEDGLYKLDGYTVERVEDSFSHLFVNKNQDKANTCFFDGKLYIACSLNFFDDEVIGCENDNFENNSLIEFDIVTKEYNITRGIDVVSMLAVKDLCISKMFLCLNNNLGFKFWELTKNGKVEEVVLKKKWQGGKINFGTFDKTKILKEIYLICKNDCFIELETENCKKTYFVKGKEEIQRVRINCKGKYFKTSFVSEKENVFISNPQFIFNVED